MPGIARSILCVAGSGLLVFAGAFFWRCHVRPVRRARDRIDRDAELIDAVQQTALELVVTARVFQDLAFSHADWIASLVRGVGPQLRAVPYVGRGLGEAIERSETLAADIARLSGRARSVTDDIERALRESDVEAMRAYLERLRGVRREASHVAPDRDAPGPSAPAGPE